MTKSQAKRWVCRRAALWIAERMDRPFTETERYEFAGSNWERITQAFRELAGELETRGREVGQKP